MSQQQSGFLYTQMTQSEPEFNSFPDPAIGKGNCSSGRTMTNVTTHGYNTREHVESYCNPETATEKALSNDEPDYLTNKANAPLDAKQSHTMPSRPMFERVGTGSRNQLSKERLQMTDELLRKETTPTCFAQCTFQTAGKGAVISVTEEHLSRATALLQDASAEKDPFVPLRDFSSTSTSCRQPEALFHTAGKKNVISVSEDSMARATTLLQNASVPAVDVDRKESSPQATSSVSASAPQFAATFHTAGKKAIVSVTDDSMTWANALLHDATANDAPKIFSIPVVANAGPQSASMFQTAGTGSLITVKDESMARATALLNDTVSVSTSRDLSSAPRRSSQIGSMFQTAGKGSVISVSDDSMARATAPLQKASATDGKDSKQAISSFTPRSPQYAAAFHTAGKKNVITVTEGSMVRAITLLQGATTTDVELSPQPRLLPVANSPQLVAMFQTAGKGSVISVQEESIARATALLQDKSVATSEVETYPLSRDLSSAPTSLPQPGSMFQTAGKGSVISVSDGSMALATAILQDSSVTVDKARKNESSQAVSSISTSVPQVATMFHTAGKKNVLSVTEDGILRAKTLLQDERATEVKPVSKMRLSPVAKGPVAMFQTAGKGSVISVQEESIARATALLQDKSVATSEVDTYPLSRDLSSAPTILLQPRSMFQTAGKGSVISVSDDSIARATALLQDSSVPIAEAGTKESSQAASSVPASTSDPQFTATFLTAGKNAVVSVTEHTNALLQETTATFVEQASQICLSSAANGSQSAIKFQTVGKGRVVSMKEESMAWATTLLKDTPASNFEVDLKKPPRELPSAETIYPGSAAIFQAAGQGSLVSVSEESLARAVEVLHDSWVANEDETTTRAFQGGDMMSSPVKKRARIDVSDECRVKAAEDATKECNTGFANNSCDYTEDTDEGLITQPVPPETPRLPYRRDQLESLQHEETYVAIRSVAFGLTPQSQHTRGHLAQRRQEAFDSSPETNFESPDDVHPEPYTNLANQATPASRLLVSETRKRRSSLSHSILAQPAFTPKQTPAANASAAVTMSVDPKNPYIRNRYNNPNSSPNLKDAYSPVPIDFRHTDGSFRGKVISPSSISYAESVLSRRPGESGNELKKLPVSAHPGESTLLDSRTKKKVVTWSEDTVKSDQVPTRTTLSNFAAEYGKMNDYVSVGLDAGIHAVTLAIDSNNAPRIRFDAESELPCSLFGQPCPPKCKIVGSVKDLRASLLSRGCEEKKLVDKWISNHYRWIVWKLASMERRFASSLAHSYLTYDHVITQLKMRYDRELKGGERSALRKVLNRDVAANCMMILCVCQTLRPITDEGTDNKDSKHDECALEMTDGWYSIRGVLDASLTAHVRNGKIKVGTKLLICNGRLEGSEDGVDPLDPSYSCSGQNCSVALCLSANGTRLANWDAKMGFVKPSQYIRSTRGSLLVRSISHIIPGGGNVPLIDVIICRLYPRMFLERKGTSNPSEALERPGGKSPVISEAQEYKNRMDFEKKRQQAIERMSETVQNECAKVRHRRSLILDYRSLTLCRFHRIFLSSCNRKWTRWHQSYGGV
jgi:breast cancer 2 susceptibility protein